MSRQTGFSLPETLFALLLFALGITALMRYQLALATSFEQQLQQRAALRLAWQRLEGLTMPGWHSEISEQAGPEGCRFITVTIVSPAARRAKLTLLRCSRR